jgi:hypothetical protein
MCHNQKSNRRFEKEAGAVRSERRNVLSGSIIRLAAF